VHSMQTRFSSYRESSSLPMGILGLAYLAVYSIEVIFGANSELVYAMQIAGQFLWLIFFVDLIIRAITSKSISDFLKSSWLEIFALTLPFIRFLRIFRVVLALRAIRGIVRDKATRTGVYVLLLVPLTWFSGAVAVLDAESKNSDSGIQTIREALWWSLATITTVGYGDKYPTTLEGQLVAGVLMVAGIALFSAGAAIFASWMLGDSSPVNKTKDD
jgi:voltage-gated potassium channel